MMTQLQLAGFPSHDLDFPIIKRFKKKWKSTICIFLQAGSYQYNSDLLGESLKGAINGVITPLVRQVTIKKRRSDHIPQSDHLFDELKEEAYCANAAGFKASTYEQTKLGSSCLVFSLILVMHHRPTFKKRFLLGNLQVISKQVGDITNGYKKIQFKVMLKLNDFIKVSVLFQHETSFPFMVQQGSPKKNYFVKQLLCSRSKQRLVCCCQLLAASLVPSSIYNLGSGKLCPYSGVQQQGQGQEEDST